MLQDILYRRKLHFAQMADSTHQLGAPGEKIVPVGSDGVLIERGEAGNDIVDFFMTQGESEIALILLPVQRRVLHGGSAGFKIISLRGSLRA